MQLSSYDPTLEEPGLRGKQVMSNVVPASGITRPSACLNILIAIEQYSFYLANLAQRQERRDRNLNGI
jgi:hypothetical protein